MASLGQHGIDALFHTRFAKTILRCFSIGCILTILMVLPTWVKAEVTSFDDIVVFNAHSGVDVRIRSNYTYRSPDEVNYPDTWSTVVHITIVNRRNWTITFDYLLGHKPTRSICGNFQHYGRSLAQADANSERYGCRLTFYYLQEKITPWDVYWELNLKTGPNFNNLLARGNEILSRPKISIQEYTEVINLFTEALNLEPDQADLRETIAALKRERAKLADRISTQERFNNYLELANRSERRKDYTDAIRLYKLALELDPTNEQIPKRLKELRQAQAELRAQVEEEVKSDPLTTAVPYPGAPKPDDRQNDNLAGAEKEKRAAWEVQHAAEAQQAAAADAKKEASFAAYRERQQAALEEKQRQEAAEREAYKEKVDSILQYLEEHKVAAQQEMQESVQEYVESQQRHWQVIVQHYTKLNDKYVPIKADSVLMAGFNRAASAKVVVNDFLETIDEDALENEILKELSEPEPCRYLVLRERTVEFGDPFFGGVVDTSTVRIFLSHVTAHGCPTDNASPITEVWALSREEALSTAAYGLSDRTVFYSAVVIRKGWAYRFPDDTSFHMYSGPGGKEGIVLRQSLQQPAFWLEEKIWDITARIGIPD